MAFQNGEASKDLLAHIWKHVFSFINSMLLKFAVQLQIPINRHGSPMLLSELEEPLSARHFLLPVLDPIRMDPWQHMSKWSQNDDVTLFYTTHGRMFYIQRNC
ncbi:putative winged helix-like DNA-binding domain superfamily [Helianthus anomalus]